MAVSKQLELHEDQRFNRMEWRVQSAGWVVWALVVLAALAGLFGSGPLSSREVDAADGSLTIAYERFVRYQNPGTMEITVRPHNGDHLVSLQFSQAFLEGMEISRMEPEPQWRTLRGTSIVYEFPRHEGIKAAAIRLHFTFERFGRHGGRIGLVGHEPISLSQFIYP